MAESFNQPTTRDALITLIETMRSPEDSAIFTRLLGLLDGTQLTPDSERVLLDVVSNTGIDYHQFADVVARIMANPLQPDLSRWQPGARETVSAQADEETPAIPEAPTELVTPTAPSSIPLGSTVEWDDDDNLVVVPNQQPAVEADTNEPYAPNADEYTISTVDTNGAPVGTPLPPRNRMGRFTKRKARDANEAPAPDAATTSQPIREEVVPGAFLNLPNTGQFAQDNGEAGATEDVPETPASAPAIEPPPTPSEPSQSATEQLNTAPTSEEPPEADLESTPDVSDSAPVESHTGSYSRALESYRGVFGVEPETSDIERWQALSDRERFKQAYEAVIATGRRYAEVTRNYEITRLTETARKHTGFGFLTRTSQETRDRLESEKAMQRATRDRYTIALIEYERLGNVSLGQADALTPDNAYHIAQILRKSESEMASEAREEYSRSHGPVTWLDKVVNRGRQAFQWADKDLKDSNAWQYLAERDWVRKSRAWLEGQNVNGDLERVLHTGLRYAVPATKIALKTKMAVPILMSLGASKLMGFAGDKLRHWRHEWNNQLNQDLALEFATESPVMTEQMKLVVNHMTERWQSQDRNDRYYKWAQTLLTMPAAYLVGDLGKNLSWDSLRNIKVALPDIKVPTVKMPEFKLPPIASPHGVEHGMGLHAPDSLATEHTPIDTTNHASDNGYVSEDMGGRSSSSIPSEQVQTESAPPPPPPPDKPKASWWNWRSWFGEGDDAGSSETPAQQSISHEPASSAPAQSVLDTAASSDHSGAVYGASGHESADITHETHESASGTGGSQSMDELENIPAESVTLEGLHGTMYDIQDGDGFTQAFERMLGPGGLSAGQTPDWFGDGIPLGEDGYHYDMNSNQLSDFAHRVGLINNAGESIVMEPGDSIGFDSDGRLIIERNGKITRVTNIDGQPLPGLAGLGFEFKKY